MNTIPSIALATSLICLLGCDDNKQQQPANAGRSSRPEAPPEGSVGQQQPQSVGQQPEIPSRIGITFKLARGFESSTGGMGGFGGGGGYRYELRIEIGNPNSTPFSFDAVDIYFTDGLDRQSEKSFYQSGETVFLTDTGITTFYRYGEREGLNENIKMPNIKSADEKESVLSEVILESHRATTFSSSITANAIPTITGKPPTVINVRLFSAGKMVGELYRAALPPLMKIPDEYESGRNEDKWYQLRLLPAQNLPASSDIFDQAVVNAIFEKAASISPEAVLAAVSPEVMTIDTYHRGNTMMRPDGWRYEFWSPTKAFNVSKLDPGALTTTDDVTQPSVTIDKDLLKTCGIDCDVAVMVLEQAGAESIGEKNARFELIGMKVGATTRPVWDVTYRFKGRKVYVLADTGQIVCKEGDSLMLFNEIIGN